MGAKSIFIWILLFSLSINLSYAESDLVSSNGSLVLNQYYYGTPQNQYSEECKTQDNENNTFLNTVIMFLGIYGIIIAILLGIGWFLNHKDIKDIKASVHRELEKDFGDKAQSIVKETMKSRYDIPVNETKEGIIRLENYIKDLKRAIETEQPIPPYPEEDDDNKTKEKNVFDES